MSTKTQTSTVTLEHNHPDNSGSCPFSKASALPSARHTWCPRQPTDIRSPCPALNALANHGYINRSGKQIYIWDIAIALYKGYALTLPFAIFLSVGTLFLIRHWNPFRPLDLARVGVHGGVEHNASVVHPDVDVNAGLTYASSDIDPGLVKRLEEEVKANGIREKPVAVDYIDVARARIRREKECGPIDSMHQEIARGELAIALGCWDRRKLGIEGNAEGVPLDWLLEWIGTERLPSQWTQRLANGTAQRTGLFETMKRAKSIKLEVERMRAAAKN